MFNILISLINKNNGFLQNQVKLFRHVFDVKF